MEDWDLNAIVRRCLLSSSPAASSTTTTTTSDYTVVDFSSLPLHFHPRKDDFVLPPSTTHGGGGGGDDDLHEIYRPFFFSNPASISQKSISFVSSPVEFPQPPDPPPHKWVEEKHLLHSAISRCSPPVYHHHLHSRSPRLKRRKSQTRRVCHMPAEELSSDEWAWRKYGQKPIKGSPYPRGYYRCSSSKGCTARKQVERNKSDPAMFILTYTGEHSHPPPTHRNSLAGSIRPKPATQIPAIVAGKDLPEMTAEEEKELELESEEGEEEEEGEEMGLHDLMVREDIFNGLEDILGGEIVVSGEAMPTAASSLPWLPPPKKAATAAGGSCC